MSQTTEERKIKRLEAEVKRLNIQIDNLKKTNQRYQTMLHSERRWRQDFQSLLKDVVHEDDVGELNIW